MAQRRQHLAGAIHEWRRARGAARDHARAQGRQIARPGFLGVDQELQVGVEAVDVRGPLALHEVERLVGIERVGEDLPVAREHRAERPLDVPKDVEER